MQSSTQAYYQLRELEALSGKNDKKDALDKIWYSPINDTFRIAVCNALDPFITFGINNLKFLVNLNGEEDWNEGTLDLLDKLSTRELSGKAAKEALQAEMSRLNVESYTLLGDVITGKLGAGFTANTVNQVSPNTIYLFKMCLAEKFSSDLVTGEQWGQGVFGEIKEDGVRGVSLASKGYHFVSRNGLPLNSDQATRDQVKAFLRLWSEEHNKPHMAFETFNLDGELVEASDVFEESSGSSRSKDESRANTLNVKVIDVLSESEMDNKESDDDYLTRRARLEAFFNEHGHKFPKLQLIDRFIFHSEDEMWAKFYELRQSGKEGLIIKLTDGVWEQKRSKSWLKVKDVMAVDLSVVDAEAGDPNGRFANTLGALICEYINKKGDKVRVKVGGGFSEQMRHRIWSYVTGEPITYKGEVVEPYNPYEYLLEVHAHEETRAGSLREPRAKKFRTDKPKEEGQGC